MATSQKIIEDLGSELVEELRKQINRLTTAVEAIKAAAVTDGNTFQSNVAALTELDDFLSLDRTKDRAAAPRFPRADD